MKILLYKYPPSLGYPNGMEVSVDSNRITSMTENTETGMIEILMSDYSSIEINSNIIDDYIKNFKGGK